MKATSQAGSRNQSRRCWSHPLVRLADGVGESVKQARNAVPVHPVPPRHRPNLISTRRISNQYASIFQSPQMRMKIRLRATQQPLQLGSRTWATLLKRADNRHAHTRAEHIDRILDRDRKVRTSDPRHLGIVLDAALA